MRVLRFATPILALAAIGCAEAFIEGTHHPMLVQVTPSSAICDVTQGDAHIGMVRHGVGKFDLAKGLEIVTVKCTALGYEARTAAIPSSFPFHATFRCVLDALCEPAVQSGGLNQYPTRVEMILPAVPQTAAQKSAAAKVRTAFVTSGPEPAATPTTPETDAVSLKRLPPLPPAVAALRTKTGDDNKPMPTTDAKAEAKLAGEMGDAPLGTWRTTPNGAQAWWGRDVPHSFTMPPTALLSLQHTSGEWGLFDYQGKDGTRGRVWIALNDVRFAN